MKVAKLETYIRTSKGKLIGGVVTFSDGKEWKWHRSIHDGSFFFTIDSGVASQWGFCNYGRTVAYPKRIAALKAALSELGEL